ncbi:MAG: hypothetical protein JZU65_05955 [Chlorobium sp.]|nr:hypothetical protein [Chlorobium sp.]
MQNDVRVAAEKYLNGASVVPDIKKSSGKIAKWPLKNSDRAQFPKFVEALGTAKEFFA